MDVGSAEAMATDRESQGVQTDAAGEKRASIGVNLRVTGHCQQGGRKYMEDYFAVAYQQTDDVKDLEYAFFGIFDGHGGAEAAAFAKEHLMEFIVKDPRFWYDNDDDVLLAIKDGFIDTHHAMWKVHDKWPKTATGLPSTAGTTASIAFIRRGKIYIGHVGDSGITLGYQNPGCPDWQAKCLTKDHKPECEHELARIEQSGGKVIAKMGVPRVVWNRPRIGHKGPVRRSTPIDEIPFLAVARSLGDLWSYNPSNGEFVVSPKPDVGVHVIDTNTFRCLIFGTDGLYNMLSPQIAVHIVQEAERRNEERTLCSQNPNWINPSKTLVERALERWCNTKMRADNTSVITLMLDPPGPPRAQVLRTQRLERIKNMNAAVSPLASKENFDASNQNSKCKPRESTAFDPYVQTKPTDPPPPVATPNTSEIPTLAPPASTNTTLTSNLLSSSTPPPCTSNTLQKSPQNENDIQINEVTSSSFDNIDDNDNPTESEVIPDDKKKKKPNKKNVIQRKFNLRSNNQTDTLLSEKTSKMGVASTPISRRSLRENVPECSRVNATTSSCTSGSGVTATLGESRVLRERRNTTPNNNANNLNTVGGDKEKEKTFKKKGIKKKMAISNEKKKILQNLLFKKEEVSQPKTKENNAKTPPKQGGATKSSSSTPTQSPNEHLTRSRSSLKLDTVTSHPPREMRKSTLKLRVSDAMFKAKLRAHSKLTIKRKAKGLSLKKYVSS